MVVDSSELDDFRNVLRRYGLDESDFEVSEQEEEMVTNPDWLRGHVTIKCRSSGVERRYKCGHGTAWVYEFDKDLTAGVFYPQGT